MIKWRINPRLLQQRNKRTSSLDIIAVLCNLNTGELPSHRHPPIHPSYQSRQCASQPNRTRSLVIWNCEAKVVAVHSSQSSVRLELLMLLLCEWFQSRVNPVSFIIVFWRWFLLARLLLLLLLWTVTWLLLLLLFHLPVLCNRFSPSQVKWAILCCVWPSN